MLDLRQSEFRKYKSRFERGGIFFILVKKMKEKENWGFGFLVIIVSGIICFAISMSNPNLNQMELGALENLVMPFISSVIGLVLYLIVALWIFKKENWLIVSIIISILNILYGISLYIYD